MTNNDSLSNGSQDHGSSLLRSLLNAAISEGFVNCFTLTRRGWLAAGLYHSNVEISKEFYWLDKDRQEVIYFRLLIADGVKGYHISTSQLPILETIIDN